MTQSKNTAKDTMDHPRIEVENVVDRYLAGRLSEDDEALFEEHLFACPGCLEQVEAGEDMRRGLREVAVAEATVEAAAAARRVTLTLALMTWLKSRRPHQLAGLVTLALLLALLPAGMLSTWHRQQNELERLRTQLATGALAGPTGDLLVVSLGVVRDAGGEVLEIRLDPTKTTVLLSLELQAVEATSYRVGLYDAAGAVLWSGYGLEPNLYETLLVALPSSFLEAGDRYRILVEGGAAEGRVPAGEVEFEVLATAR